LLTYKRRQGMPIFSATYPCCYLGSAFAGPARISLKTPALVASPAHQALELCPHRWRNVAAFERIDDVGRKKTHLRAAVEAPAFKFEAVERLGLGELDHRVGELDLAARAAASRPQEC
jgi:hypothetical protein